MSQSSENLNTLPLTNITTPPSRDTSNETVGTVHHTATLVATRPPLVDKNVNTLGTLNDEVTPSSKQLQMTSGTKRQIANDGEQRPGEKRQCLCTTETEVDVVHQEFLPIRINNCISGKWNAFLYPQPHILAYEGLSPKSILFQTDEVDLSKFDRELMAEISKGVEQCIKDECQRKLTLPLHQISWDSRSKCQVSKRQFDDGKWFVRVWFESEENAAAFSAYIDRIRITPERKKAFFLCKFGQSRCHPENFLTISMKPIGENDKEVPLEDYQFAIEKMLKGFPDVTLKGAWKIVEKQNENIIKESQEVWFTLWREQNFEWKNLPGFITAGGILWSQQHPEGTGLFKLTYKDRLNYCGQCLFTVYGKDGLCCLKKK